MPPAIPNYAHRATLDRALDGDTYWMRIDFGIFAGCKMDPLFLVRLEGIDCWELSEPQGPAARMAATQHLTSGLPVVVQTIKPVPNPMFAPLGATFARTRARIWVGDDELAGLLRAGGHAKGTPRLV